MKHHTIQKNKFHGNLIEWCSWLLTIVIVTLTSELDSLSLVYVTFVIANKKEVKIKIYRTVVSTDFLITLMNK